MSKSLYVRLGGKIAIRAVVDDFLTRASTNPKVNWSREGKFSDMDMNKMKDHLADFLGSALGGPDVYKGRSLTDSHRGMMITEAEFDAIAGDLATTLDKMGVAPQEKSELMALVSGTRGQIVGK